MQEHRVREMQEHAVAELLMRLRSDMPLWSGVITVQHEYFKANSTTPFRKIRSIMNAHARVICNIEEPM